MEQILKREEVINELQKKFDFNEERAVKFADKVLSIVQKQLEIKFAEKIDEMPEKEREEAKKILSGDSIEAITGLINKVFPNLHKLVIDMKDNILDEIGQTYKESIEKETEKLDKAREKYIKQKSGNKSKIIITILLIIAGVLWFFYEKYY